MSVLKYIHINLENLEMEMYYFCYNMAYPRRRLTRTHCFYFSDCLALCGIAILLMCTNNTRVVAETDTIRLGIVCVQFADLQSNIDARGSYGWIDTDTDNVPDTGQADKYRYRDFWNFFFQESGNRISPDYDSHRGIDKGFFENRLNLDQGPSLRAYYEENSYGHFSVLPAFTRTNESGILNSVSYSGNDPTNGIIQWITLSKPKSHYSEPSEVVDSVQKENYKLLRDSIPDFDNFTYDQIYIVFAGGCLSWCIGRPGCSASMYGPTKNSTSTFMNGYTVFHEFGHQQGFIDLYGPFYEVSRTWVGNLSLMGYGKSLCSQTPPHIDPWHKIKKGDLNTSS